MHGKMHKWSSYTAQQSIVCATVTSGNALKEMEPLQIQILLLEPTCDDYGSRLMERAERYHMAIQQALWQKVALIWTSQVWLPQDTSAFSLCKSFPSMKIRVQKLQGQDSVWRQVEGESVQVRHVCQRIGNAKDWSHKSRDRWHMMWSRVYIAGKSFPVSDVSFAVSI